MFPCGLFSWGVVISQVTLRPLRTIVGMTTIATVLFGAWNAYADQRGDALDAAIPAAMRWYLARWPRTLRTDLWRTQCGDARADGT